MQHIRKPFAGSSKETEDMHAFYSRVIGLFKLGGELYIYIKT